MGSFPIEVKDVLFASCLRSPIFPQLIGSSLPFCACLTCVVKPKALSEAARVLGQWRPHLTSFVGVDLKERSLWELD